jgi:hypothetical protein
MLEIQKQIREFGVDAVVEKYSLTKRTHSKYPNLTLLKYDIFSPMGEKAVQECRGIILDAANDWKVVCRTFDKFFNLHEGHAAKIDWITATALEKLDGSLVQMYHYDGQWQFATSGSPDAGGMAHESGVTFQELIRTVFNELDYHYPEAIYMCFAFELITKYNKIVVDYKGVNRLVLLGARNRIDGEEFDPGEIVSFCGLNYEVVKAYDELNSLEQIQQTLPNMSGVDSEGYVVVDANYNRVKIKSPHYVALHRLKGEYFNKKRALELILIGETSEVLTYFPEWTDEIGEVENALENLKGNYNALYASLADIESQKEFALNVTKQAKIPGVLFAMRKGKTFDEAIRDVNIKSVLAVLGLED